jgi:uncharacterized protein (DUF2164 family)
VYSSLYPNLKGRLGVFIKLTKEQHKRMIEDIQIFFSEEREEELSEFAAERVLDFVKESLAPHFYNAAIADVKHVVEQQYASMEDEILTLERPVK